MEDKIIEINNLQEFLDLAKEEKMTEEEKILREYVYKFGNDYSSHKNKRKVQIDKWFPYNKQKVIV